MLKPVNKHNMSSDNNKQTQDSYVNVFSGLNVIPCVCMCVCMCSGAIQRAMCEAFTVPPGSECRLWMKSSDSSCERLRNVHVSVLDACLSSGMVRTMMSLDVLNDEVTNVFPPAHSCCLSFEDKKVRTSEISCNMPLCVCACVCACVCVCACDRR